MIALVALAAMAPRLWRVATQFDLAGNFTSSEVRRQGGVLAAALAGRHLADLANVILLLAPLAPLAPLALLAPWAPRTRSQRGEAAVLAALLIPLLGLAPFFHPPQGLFRDWDGFAATAMALSLVVAWTVGRILDSSARGAGLAVLVMLGAVAPAVAWLAHNADPDRGMARVEAYLVGPPARTDLSSASGWEFLGMRHMDLRRADAAASAFARAAEIAPSPKTWSANGASRGASPSVPGTYNGSSWPGPMPNLCAGTYRSISARSSSLQDAHPHRAREPEHHDPVVSALP